VASAALAAQGFREQPGVQDEAHRGPSRRSQRVVPRMRLQRGRGRRPKLAGVARQRATRAAASEVMLPHIERTINEGMDFAAIVD
jgi:hypothetical protein